MKIPILPGVFDILPEDKSEMWHNSYIWSYLENIIRETAQQYGLLEIRTPIFERTELFTRGVGESSDIVTKEMYTFMDKGERSVTLRPEGTAPVIRSFVEHQMHQSGPVHKLFYIGPMFRYERAQAGRYRQFHQFGVEIIGIASPEQDAELIDLAYTIYNKLGLKNLVININSIGNLESRAKYREALQNYLKVSFDKLSEDSQKRFYTNPFRILDSKDPNDQAVLSQAPSILDFLDDDSRQHFEEVKKYLNELSIPYVINPRLVRGLDYYNKTVFEIVAGELGAQNSIGGGGRFDGLISTLGGPDLPATGYATGLERVIQTMLKQGVPLPPPPSPMLYLIPLGDSAKSTCLQIMKQLRNHGLDIQMEFSAKKLQRAMQYADQIKAKYVAVVGDQELQNQQVELKEMATGEKTTVPLFHLSRILEVDAKSDTYLKLWTELAKPFETKDEADFFLKRISRDIEQTKKITQDLQKAMHTIEGILDSTN